MIYSMTGYGKGLVKAEKFIVEAELKSFNSRYLDLSVRIPRDLSAKEFEIRDLIKNNIKRGKVVLNLYISTESGQDKFTTVSEPGLKQAVALLKDIKSAGGLEEKITIEHILELQDMYFSNEIPFLDEDYKSIEEAIKMAIDNLNAMRLQEGKELVIDLEERIRIIESQLEKIEDDNKSSIEVYFDRMKDRAVQLVNTLGEQSDRLETELALLVEKYDVTEECVRLRSHIKMFLEAMRNSKEIGKRINFICQEMNREANTINSKTVSSEISHFGIIIKEELEKIREQIQNIE